MRSRPTIPVAGSRRSTAAAALIAGTNYVTSTEAFLVGSRAGGVTFGTHKTPRRYIVAEGGGNTRDVNVSRTAAAEWETFFVINQ
jgi:hypothetical protein